MTIQKPDPKEVRALREAMQAQDCLGITAAQDLCAAAVHTSNRAWRQWEKGDRKMHPAFWELAQIKLAQEGLYSDDKD